MNVTQIKQNPDLIFRIPEKEITYDKALCIPMTIVNDGITITSDTGLIIDNITRFKNFIAFHVISRKIWGGIFESKNNDVVFICNENGNFIKDIIGNYIEFDENANLMYTEETCGDVRVYSPALDFKCIEYIPYLEALWNRTIAVAHKNHVL